ncbi:uncharacterized protein LOC130735914 [Lotus japonicus]|uniref:uncharacterized protein LOC130735914 n=1 Tax=Lotus japonicus TaxID=34305 RepID=UPI002590D364|nr:uncharacterized protein LOC130735914 [Lotus japonicus]
MSNFEVVWDKCWQELSDDILYTQRGHLDYPDDQKKKNLTLAEIEKLLQNNGRSLHDFASMPYPLDIVVEDTNQRLIIEELNYDRKEMRKYLVQCLSSIANEQRHAYDKIGNVVYGKICGFFFLYGYDGTGGRAAHSRIKNHIPITEDSTCNIKHNSPRAKLFIKMKLIIWDEKLL